jgi:hypothetical protein
MRALIALLICGGCAADRPAGEEASCKEHPSDFYPAAPIIAPESSYYPLVVGATWTYKFTAPLETTTQTVTVYDPEPVEGFDPPVSAYKVVTQKAHGVTLTAWLEDTGSQIIRLRELSIDGDGDQFGDELFTPGRPLLDQVEKHLDKGSTWKTHFKDTIIDTGGTYQDCKTDQWKLADASDEVKVPAGTFQTIRVDRTDNGTSTWYAQGVGRVKQTGDTTSFELVDYSIPTP